MADIDFYGYERAQAGAYLYSSDVAAIYFDNGPGNTETGDQAPPNRAGLVQNVTASYQHSVLPRFEAGSSELFWVTGQSQGSVGMSRLVSSGGLLNGLNPGQGLSSLNNGILGSVAIKIGKLSGQLRTVALQQSQLIMRGCVLSTYSASFTTGALEVSEMTAINVALMKKLGAGGANAPSGIGTDGSGTSSTNPVQVAANAAAVGANVLGQTSALANTLASL